jgi:ribosome-binding ATPase YchF (GTP1/OBG family)
MLVVLNIGEDELQQSDFYQELLVQNAQQGIPTVLLSAEIESEIAQLEDKEDVQAFMDDMGITELGLTRLIRISYDLLGLLSFFTVGADEVRAWTIAKGTKAVHAAGVIHSDLERGFIRAEIISHEEFLRYGTLANAKQHGAVRVEGKEYLVQDGDIMNVRFNV